MFRQEEPKERMRGVIHQYDDKDRDIPEYYSEKLAVEQRLTQTRKQAEEAKLQEGPSFIDKILDHHATPAQRTSQRTEGGNILSWEEGKPSKGGHEDRHRLSMSGSQHQRNRPQQNGQCGRDAEADKFSEAQGSNFLNFGDSGNPNRFQAPTTQRRSLNMEGSLFDSMSESDAGRPKGRRKLNPDSNSYRSSVLHSPVSPQSFTEQRYQAHVDKDNQLTFSGGETPSSQPPTQDHEGEKDVRASRPPLRDPNRESVSEERPTPMRSVNRNQQRSSLSFGAAGLGSYE